MVRKRRTSVPGEGHSSGELAGVERGAGGQLRPQGQQPFQQMPEHQGGYPSGGRSGYQSAGGRIRPRGQEQFQPISEHQGGYQSGGRRGYQSGRRGGHTGGHGGRGPPAPQYPRGGATPQPGPSRPRSSDLHQATVLPYQSGRRGGHTGGRGGRGPPAPQYPRGGATPQPGPSRPRPSDLHQATMLPYQAAPNNSNLQQFMSRLEDGIQFLLTLFLAVYQTLVIVQQLREKVKEGHVFLLKR